MMHLARGPHKPLMVNEPLGTVVEWGLHLVASIGGEQQSAVQRDASCEQAEGHPRHHTPTPSVSNSV